MKNIQHKEIPIDEIILLDENPREISDIDLQKLAKDIESDPAFLEQRPSLINYKDGKYYCYAGSQRVKAQKLLGRTTAICFIEENVPDNLQKERKEIFRGNRIILVCERCNTLFFSNKVSATRIPKYCSKECYGLSKRQIKTCEHCGNEFYHERSYENKKYCSSTCSSQARIGKPLSEDWKKALSEGRKNSEKCKGENLYNWKGGKSTLIQRANQYRRKRKMRMKRSLPKDIKGKLLIAQENKCFYCEKEFTDYIAIDHIVPINKGGDNHENNIVLTCKYCNSSKNALTLAEFAQKINKPDLISKHIKLCETLNFEIPEVYYQECSCH